MHASGSTRIEPSLSMLDIMLVEVELLLGWDVFGHGKILKKECIDEF